MNETVNSQIIDIRPHAMVQVALLGVILGAAVWVVTQLLSHFVVGALVCGDQGAGCDSAVLVSGNIALILVAVGGLLGFVRMGIYRPLLVVIAATIVLWGLAGYILGLQWYEAMAWTVLLTAIVYTAFVWLVRPRLFLLAIVLVLIVIILARIMPVLT
ncbi:MAG: hypothetical protein WAS27_00525 [Candidatus Saccharimonadales bacterium]